MATYTMTITATVATIFNALWGREHGGVDYRQVADELSHGCYPGTDEPVRRVDPTKIVSLVFVPGGGAVRDTEGGWIADRFGNLGHRETSEAINWLKVRGFSVVGCKLNLRD